MLSDALNFDNSLEMLSELLKVGTPNRCLWQDDIRQELNLLVTILGQSILFVHQTGRVHWPSILQIQPLAICIQHLTMSHIQVFLSKAQYTPSIYLSYTPGTIFRPSFSPQITISLNFAVYLSRSILFLHFLLCFKYRKNIYVGLFRLISLFSQPLDH